MSKQVKNKKVKKLKTYLKNDEKCPKNAEKCQEMSENVEKR